MHGGLCERGHWWVAQVLQTRRALTKRVQDAKSQIKAYLNRHKLTARYAKEPFVTGVLYAIVVLPAAVALPLASALAGTALHQLA